MLVRTLGKICSRKETPVAAQKAVQAAPNRGGSWGIPRTRWRGGSCPFGSPKGRQGAHSGSGSWGAPWTRWREDGGSPSSPGGEQDASNGGGSDPPAKRVYLSSRFATKLFRKLQFMELTDEEEAFHIRSTVNIQQIVKFNVCKISSWRPPSQPANFCFQVLTLTICAADLAPTPETASHSDFHLPLSVLSH
jgi:hypothetical protein